MSQMDTPCVILARLQIDLKDFHKHQHVARWCESASTFVSIEIGLYLLRRKLKDGSEITVAKFPTIKKGENWWREQTKRKWPHRTRYVFRLSASCS